MICLINEWKFFSFMYTGCAKHFLFCAKSEIYSTCIIMTLLLFLYYNLNHCIKLFFSIIFRYNKYFKLNWFLIILWGAQMKNEKKVTYGVLLTYLICWNKSEIRITLIYFQCMNVILAAHVEWMHYNGFFLRILTGYKPLAWSVSIFVKSTLTFVIYNHQLFLVVALTCHMVSSFPHYAVYRAFNKCSMLQILSSLHIS